MNQRNFLTAAAVGLVLACGSGPSQAQIKSASAVTTPSFTQDIRGALPAGSITAGATSREFGAAAYNSAGANGSDGVLTVGANDIMFKTNWYFRVGGATAESRFAAPDTATLTGDTATLNYTSLAAGAFSAALTVTVAEPTAGQGTQYSSMSITNPGAAPLTIDLFNYTDIDANGDFGNDSATDISSGGNVVIEVTDAADTVQVGGEGATAFQVIEWDADPAALPQTLESTDANVTNLDNSGLPFGPGDFTSTVQWAGLTVPAGGTITVRHGIANNTDLVFGGGGGDEPEIEVTPAALSFTADVDGTDSGDLSITNIGDGTLTWSIDTAEPAAGSALAPRSAGRANGELTLGRTDTVAGRQGSPIAPRGDIALSQTTSTTPVALNSVSCNQEGVGHADNSYFRRYYFDEHAGIGASATINSVDVSVEEASGSANTLIVNLYTIPSGTAVDTIPLASLTSIGTATVTVPPITLGSINVPVIGSVADTAASDLVVEVFTPNGQTTGENFFIGSTNTPETHPSFLMAADCGITTPTDTTAIGFPDMNIIVVVNATDGGGPGPVGCDNPSTIPWLDVGTTSGSAAAGETDLSTITADATGLAAGTYDALLCVNSNDSVGNELVEVPVEFIVKGEDDTIFANGFECGEGFPGCDVTPTCEPLQLLADPSFETTDGDSGPNPSWVGEDSNGDGTPFWTAGSTTLSAAHEGDFVVWGGGWGSASTQNWSQSVTIPSGSPRFLNFWRQVDALPGSTGTLTASVDGTAVSTLDVVANGVDGDWVSVSVDVSAHADGAAHAIEFEYAGTGATDGNVYVDSITLECEAPTANAATPARGIAPNATASKRDLAPAAAPSGKRKYR